MGSQISVLTSSMFNTANLFTDSDWGALFAGCTKQNPPPEGEHVFSSSTASFRAIKSLINSSFCSAVNLQTSK